MRDTVCIKPGNPSGEVITDGDLQCRRASRVSVLRDMFQTGTVVPIEEIENDISIPFEDAHNVPRLENTANISPPERLPKPQNIALDRSRLKSRMNIKQKIILDAKPASETRRNLREIKTDGNQSGGQSIIYTVGKLSSSVKKSNQNSANLAQLMTPVFKSASAKSNCSKIGEEQTQVKLTDVQDFVVRPEAFHSTTDSKHSPVLQHAERISIEGTPDGDEDKQLTTRSSLLVGGESATNDDRDEAAVLATEATYHDVLHSSPLLTKFNNLPIAKGLNVVAIDDDGTHILEDGNFFYALSGLNDQGCESPIVSSTRFCTDSHADNANSNKSGQMSISDKQADKTRESAMSNSPHSKVFTNNSIMDDDSRSHTVARQPLVRFSDDPVLVFSTFSTSDYDRRNEDVDPVASSAEYELEKIKETMTFFEIDFEKDDKGLGISIVGSGEDKLDIFIKALTPGGAAESDGRLQVYDQIMEVDNHGLVGVTHEFATQTLKSTGRLVHFVIGRHKDPPNSPIARTLLGMDECATELGKKPPNGTYGTVNGSDVTANSFSDAEGLRNLIFMATRTVKQSNNDMHLDDDDVDGSADDEDFVMGDLNGLHQEINEFDTHMDIMQYTESNVTSTDQSSDYHLRPNDFSKGPRSALKGTANAASTKRRNAAIINCVQQSLLKISSVTIPTEYENFLQTSNLNDNSVSHLCWILASELSDCRTKMGKFIAYIRNLEQRITVQEAAAEEAIERLCMNYQQLESELSDAKLQTMVQNTGEVTRLFQSEPDVPMEADETLDHRPSEKHTLNTYTQTMPSWNQLEEKQDQVASQESTTEFLDTHTTPILELPVDPKVTNETSVTCTSVDNESVPHPDLYIRQLRDRTKLLNSSVLANRRPPSHPVFSSPVDNLDEHINLFDRHNSQTNNSLGSYTSASDSCIDHSVSNSCISHSLEPIIDTESTPDGEQNLEASELKQYKIIGHRLPGLFDASQVVLRRSPGKIDAVTPATINAND